MKLFNSLTKQTEEIKPINPDFTGIYSCGPTVYDHPTIGNLTAYVFADTLRRVIVSSGQKVKHILNFTDIDDKTIARSQQIYPNLAPREALKKLTEKYEQVFLDDMQAIGNNTDALTLLKATDHIDAMQKLITDLISAKVAYVADDGVYFSIAAYRAKGKTYGQLLKLSEPSIANERINNDEYDKTSPHDFALWKKRKNKEPFWAFNFNGAELDGRPGWHIECSAMSALALGQPFDIHTGGVDLIFPHHENEIAQSTALTDSPLLAQIFAHNEHLLVSGQKMSKSLNNFYTLNDIKAKAIEPLAFRLLILQAHYRTQMNFSFDNLKAAENRLKSIQALADLRFQDHINSKEVPSSYFSDATEQILTALANDLDTPSALRHLSAVIDEFTELNPTDKSKFNSFIEFLDNVLGLSLISRADINHEQKSLLAKRAEARVRLDWPVSDKLREELHSSGLTIRDTANGQFWSRL